MSEIGVIENAGLFADAGRGHEAGMLTIEPLTRAVSRPHQKRNDQRKRVRPNGRDLK
jgi:hypothetical protein